MKGSNPESALKSISGGHIWGWMSHDESVPL